ncbi:hypothetical protein EVB62_018 [Rhizobium phage RHph_TM33]|uniref:Lipoprotein n=4 Tax=Cuernavacavirus TaxID=2731935 RepID=A0A7S5QYX2_9CAUD|nr:hypothetical protein EVB62_018 [Rhizobium phage RHph_TM33]QIG68476.1 hypothetical protein EVB63_017 [Rhizobium phage RHph_TM38]
MYKSEIQAWMTLLMVVVIYAAIVLLSGCAPVTHRYYMDERSLDYVICEQEKLCGPRSN